MLAAAARYNYAFIPHTGESVNHHEMHTTCDINEPGCEAATQTESSINRRDDGVGMAAQIERA